MSAHTWVSMQYTPIEVIPQADGSLEVSATEASLEIAEEEAKMGCWFCHAPLDTETYYTECSYEEVTMS